MLGSDERFELGEKPLTVLGDRALETYPVTLAREVECWLRAARESRSTWLDRHRFLGLVDVDYRGVHLISFLGSSWHPSRSPSAAVGCGC